MTFDCDTPIGQYSSIRADVKSDGFEISGSLKPKKLRKDDKWLPSGLIRIASGDGKDFAAVRFISEDASSNRGEIFLLFSNGGVERKTKGVALAIGEIYSFAIRVISESEVELNMGGAGLRAKVALGDTPKLLITCSAGDVEFSNLEWKSAP